MNRVETTLLDIGIPANLLGFKYLGDGINMALSDSRYLYGTTTKLYPAVAESNSTTPSRVERGIRHAIERAFNDIAPEVATQYFGNSIKPKRGVPTNSEFVAAIVLHLKEGESA